MPGFAPPPGSDEEWDALLHQLRQRPKASPRPFFYGRVQSRLLAEAKGTPWLPAWLRRPVYAAVLGALVLTVSGDGPAAAGGPRPSHPAQQVRR